MKVDVLGRAIGQFIKQNSPTLLTAMSITGTATTAYLAAAGAHEAALIIDEKQKEKSRSEDPGPLGIRDKVDLTWKLYLPAAVCGATTVACILGVRQVGAKRAAALTAAYSISDKAFSEYRDKVVEHIGSKEEQKVRDGLAEDRVAKAVANNPNVIVTGPNKVLCYEAYTDRLFESDIETLRKAENQINSMMLKGDHAAMADFYDMIGLPHTPPSWDIGWNSDRMLELGFSAVMTPDERPCISFDYNYTRHLY